VDIQRPAPGRGRRWIHLKMSRAGFSLGRLDFHISPTDLHRGPSPPAYRAPLLPFIRAARGEPRAARTFVTYNRIITSTIDYEYRQPAGVFPLRP
jgi:hypothetical protein